MKVDISTDITKNFDELLRDVSTRIGSGMPEVRGPMNGLSHRVYKLKYPSGEVLSLRIPKTKEAALGCKTGMTILEHLKMVQPSLEVPKPIYHCLEYNLLTYLDGDALGIWDIHKLVDERRHKLLYSLAEFLLKLWLSPAPQYGYEEWLCNEIDMAIRRSLPATSGWGDPLSFLCRRANMDLIVPERYRSNVAIRHGDLNAWNILINEDSVTG
ncbi:hypothetical protein E4U43_004039 [Claviceps pusilla]|uniref:Aminoglycoside phosphotransferase domain-containing protein n=1 Tax=Claviceps pusilla TaxID=123648 RepID=A0A9P7N592_9HYPO|nr:hypothetical protein E4U43_004039 [Claviceps pusilla]